MSSLNGLDTARPLSVVAPGPASPVAADANRLAPHVILLPLPAVPPVMGRHAAPGAPVREVAVLCTVQGHRVRSFQSSSNNARATIPPPTRADGGNDFSVLVRLLSASLAVGVPLAPFAPDSHGSGST